MCVIKIRLQWNYDYRKLLSARNSINYGSSMKHKLYWYWKWILSYWISNKDPKSDLIPVLLTKTQLLSKHEYCLFILLFTCRLTMKYMSKWRLLISILVHQFLFGANLTNFSFHTIEIWQKHGLIGYIVSTNKIGMLHLSKYHEIVGIRRIWSSIRQQHWQVSTSMKVLVLWQISDSFEKSCFCRPEACIYGNNLACN